MISVRRGLFGLAAVTMVVSTTLGIGAVTAKPALALNSAGCLPASGLAAPECPTVQGWGVEFLAADAGCSFGGVGACYATGQCYAAPVGLALTAGASESGDVIDVGGLQVGPLTIPPFQEQIPAAGVPASGAAGGAGGCTSAPGQSAGKLGAVGDLAPTVSGQVCQQLYAQVAGANVTGGPTNTQWVAYGAASCNPMAGTAGVGAAQSFQIYANLPGTGVTYSTLSSQMYTGLYDAVVRVFGSVDGVAIAAAGCDQGADACANDVFAV